MARNATFEGFQVGKQDARMQVATAEATNSTRLVELAINFVQAEAEAKQNLLLLCSQIIDHDGATLAEVIPAGDDDRRKLFAALHQLQRRMEMDSAILAAALGRIEAVFDTPARD